MNITTTVTWGDLISAYDTELSDLKDAYDEIRSLATDKYGEDALDRPLPSDPDHVPDDEMDLYIYQQQANQYDSGAQTIQKNKHVIETLREELGDGTFEIKMLTGGETMAVETELRMLAQQKDVSVDKIQLRRNALTTDRATIDAPEGVPREDGSPKPSEAPNALTMALWQQVERFNNAGATDFRPEGLGESDPAPSPTAEMSNPPMPTDASPSDSDPTDDDAQPRGD